MTTLILATKLYMPAPRPDVVARTHLIERLNEGVHRKLTLISAPAGFGKTTLVTEWIAGGGRSVAWLSLDAGDGDVTRFLTYLVAALQTLPPQEGDTKNGPTVFEQGTLGQGALELLQSPQPPPAESVLTVLLNEIASIPDKFILVLDDYHLIDAPPVHESLSFLLEHLPPQMHLVITTRENPPLPLARYRGRGQFTELQAADLRFTLDEATEFLNQMMGLALSADQVAALETRTEGWISGLQLAALSMQGQGENGRNDLDSFIQAFSGSHHFIVDYLVEEVLHRQPTHVRHFLLRTSILDRLTGPLCDAVVGIEEEQEDGREMLATLNRGNLFVIPLDDERQWYRYHHLFADVLHAHLLEEQPAILPVLHRRACEWYARNGLRADAIRHALIAQDFPRAADLLELIWPEMDGTFQTAPWLEWAKSLPDDLVRTRPVLGVAYAWALLNIGNLEAARARLRGIEADLDDSEGGDKTEEPSGGAMVVVDHEQFRTLPASMATARAYHAQAVDDVSGSITFAERALALLPEDSHIQRGPAASLLGLAYWRRGELEAAHQALAEAMDGFRAAGNIHFAISGTYGLADIRATQGRLHDATKTYEQALLLVAAQGGRPIGGTTDLYLGLSELYLEQGDQEAARENRFKNAELGEHAALADWPYRWRIIEARFKSSEDDLDGALNLLDEAERLYFPTPIPNVRPVAAQKARVWIAQGRLSAALRWVLERGLSVDDDLTFLSEFEHVTLARVLIAQYRHDRANEVIANAIDLLARLLKAAEAGERQRSVIEILILQALAHQAQETMSKALDALARALSLAESEGYVRIFVDEGPPMEMLLRTATKAGIFPDYVRRLQAAMSGAVRRTPTVQSLVEPLSERELDVLRLLRSELSGPEIANELMVSLNTMRTHTKNIYSKLGVTSRRAAVRRAEELDLR